MTGDRSCILLTIREALRLATIARQVPLSDADERLISDLERLIAVATPRQCA